jgi:hypothetical protein
MHLLISARTKTGFQKTIDSTEDFFENIYAISDFPIENKKIKKIFISNSKNRSKELNLFLKEIPDGSFLFLRDGETILKINNSLNIDKQGVGIVYKDFIRKELRICNKDQLFFDNWHSEMIPGDFQTNPNIIIKAPTDVLFSPSEDWISYEPTSRSALFYQALNCYYNKEYDKFLSMADHLLFTHKIPLENELWILMFMSYLYFFKYNMPNDGVRSISLALAKKPEMAEFWCIIGDFYFKNKLYEMSKTCFKYALASAKIRDTTDPYFIFPKKYKDHPENMIATMESIDKV